MNFQALIIGEAPDISEFLSLILEGQYQVEMTEVKDHETAVDYIKDRDQEFIAIINTIHTKDVTKTTPYLENLLSRKCPFIQILDVSQIIPEEHKEFFKDSQYHYMIPKELIHKDIMRVCAEIEKRYGLSGKIERSKTKDGIELFPIQIERYLKRDSADSDIFIRIGKGKFIKLIKNGEEIDKDKIKDYLSKGERFLYQGKEDYLKCVNRELNLLSSRFAEEKKTKAQKIQLQLSTIKEVQDVVKQLGISPHVIEATDEVVKSVEDVLKSAQNLGKLIKQLMGLKDIFFTRTSINNYIIGGICKSVEWSTHETFKKLVYASIFCDFGFNKSDTQLSTVLSLNDLSGVKLEAAQISKIKHHPAMSAAYLEKTASFLTDEVGLILSHHEKPDGSGFPKGLNYKTTPLLQALFILSYDYTTRLILSCESVEEMDAKQVFRDLPKEYSLGSYEKPYNALRKLLRIDQPDD